MSTEVTGQPRPSRLLPYYISLVVVVALAAGALSWAFGRHPEPAPMLLLLLMGIVSFTMREPNVGSRIGFSFLSIILLASAAILGPFGAWVIGVVSPAASRKGRWFQTIFNMAMTGIGGAAGAWAYVLVKGTSDLDSARGPVHLALGVGLPLIVADVVQCLTNAVLISGVIHFDQGIPFGVLVRRVLTTSGWAYLGYGVIGFLFVILWFPAQVGAFSAVLVIAPLLAARWAFIQYGEELRSHERTVDTLVTALGTKEPAAVDRSRRVARFAEWIAEELGLGPNQIVTVRHAAILHEIGHLGVPTRLLRRSPSTFTDSERRVVDRHCVVGSRMIEGIDFLEDARSGIRHQNERWDGRGRPDGLAGGEIPLAARIVAVASQLEELAREGDLRGPRTATEALRLLARDRGRFDPTIVEAALTVVDKHVWPSAPVGVGDA